MRNFRMRTCAIIASLLVVMALVAVTGCSQSDKKAKVADRAKMPDEESAASAATRGVPQEGYGEDVEPVPQVVLSKMTYEWRVSPERGLAVVLDFTNPADTYERARGYVFLIAENQKSGNVVATGVFPWSTKMEGNMPADYTEGSHLLFRDNQTVRAFIPYKGTSGYYNRLRLYVYHEDGKLLTNRSYDLDITGEPGQSGSVRPGFDL